MAIMEQNSESSQQPKAENVKITIDDLTQSMKKKFSRYNVKDQKPVVACNYRVPDNLRKGNEDAYTPKVVSIGPIHHGKPQLQTMERSKWMFLGWYFERSSSVSFDDMVRVAIDIEEYARTSYLERFDNISSQEFSEMIILDFIFLIEFFFKFPFENEATMKPFEEDIFRDTILLENQFPKNLVTHLFHMLYKGHDLRGLILYYFRIAFDASPLNVSPNDWSSAADMLDFLVTCHVGETESISSVKIERNQIQRTHSATELQEGGVKFSKVDKAVFSLDVKFVNGVLEMPVIELDFVTESRFRNMIASEQSRHNKPKRVGGYVKLMAVLLKSTKDVELLTNCGIIRHPSHDNEQVRCLFDNVSKGFLIDRYECYFWGLYVQMHAYSRNYWHQWKGSLFKWKRMLRENYFSSPWSIISFIAAFILLLLTAIQTAYTIKQK